MRKNVKNLLRILLLFPLVLVFGMGLYLKLTPIILKTILALRIESIPSVSGLDIRTEGVWFDSCEFTVLKI